jgi:tetratricopeptide (TPR) repeat protein
MNINKTRLYVVLASIFSLSGCQVLDMATREGVNSSIIATNTEKPSAPMVSMSAENNAVRSLVKQGMDAMERDDLLEASRFLNLSLKLDITNPDIQLLNGLVYHLMGVRGDATKYELAEQGYKQSLKFNPGNLAARYQLGLLYADQRRYGLAQGHFAAVALHRSKDTAVLYNLASAAYYARDPRSSEAALKRLMEVEPQARNKPEILKARALASAAIDNRVGAAEFISAYRKVAESDRNFQALEQRVDSWQTFYDSDAKLMLSKVAANNLSANLGDPNDLLGIPNANLGDPNDSLGDPNANLGDPNDSLGSPNASYDDMAVGADTSLSTGVDTGAFVDAGMVVVDVVLIGTQEDVRNSRGINLLNGLQLQFGDPLSGTPGFSYGKRQTSDILGTGLGLDEKLVSRARAISIPAVNYSLNIANSVDANNQVIAKPSLVAQNGQTSEFFSGTEILAAAVSGGNGDSVSVQKEVGVKLAVTPEILPNDLLRLHVIAERTFLTDPSNSVVFEFRLDTTKTNINSTVTMKFGETLILGGLSEREVSKSADGVPVLMDIPVLDYLVSQRVERQFERSVMILLTPRRPHFTRQGASDRKESEKRLSALEKDIRRLERRYGNWYTPRSVYDEVIDKLQPAEFFEEFRIGDLELHSWENEVASQELLTMARDRLLKM